MSDRKTNVEFITELMEFSKNGGLQQMFVIAAIENYANQVKNCTLEQWSKSGGASQMINFDAWQSCADEVLDKLDNR